ncbi:MAG: hypothetical protein R3E39_06430 [Anaerolineae bacterium]
MKPWRYWANEFPRSDKEIQQWIAPAANKLGGILFDTDVQHVLTGSSHISMRDILDQGLILLVHIPKGILGERSAFLLGAFIVAQIQKAALSQPIRRNDGSSTYFSTSSRTTPLITFKMS